ncbi:MAG: Mammalian cell entry related domain protein [uncultured Thiotrichaceae bacterium]|uniref:Mammalian cell entry related domain protein n=1 Tax=uncultured Thiotrichaceae bacterium TaxID=298394 RepID=A0A6S6SPL5_9GAMM|nr:MAG: Mammalian cell entry related domain protein [uncultured Thiotrichaceae bacterium]
MDKNAHYLAVGLFVIAATIAGLFFAGWLYDDQGNNHSQRYQIHFTQSVDGLATGSEVRYMGIKVGQVESTYLIPEQPGRVGVIVSVQEDTPIDGNTKATLRSQGITGVSYVNLSQHTSVEMKPLLFDEKSELAIIKSKPSELTGAIKGLPQLQKNLNHLVERANQALSDENLQTFSSILVNANQVTADANLVFSDKNMKNLSAFLENLNKTAEAGPALITDIRQSTVRLNRLLDHMDQLVAKNEADLTGSIKDLRRTLDNISKMTNHYSRLATQLNKMVDENQQQINSLLVDGGDDLKQLLIESRKTATTVRRLSEKLEQNPSQLIYEATPNGIRLPR